MTPPLAGIGSREAFEQLFGAHYWPVRDFVRRRAPDSAVEDVVAETFLVAWRRFGEIGEDPLPWLLGVARLAASWPSLWLRRRRSSSSRWPATRRGAAASA